MTIQNFEISFSLIQLGNLIPSQSTDCNYVIRILTYVSGFRLVRGLDYLSLFNKTKLKPFTPIVDELL